MGCENVARLSPEFSECVGLGRRPRRGVVPMSTRHDLGLLVGEQLSRQKPEKLFVFASLLPAP
jgi:hypothetical protein